MEKNTPQTLEEKQTQENPWNAYTRQYRKEHPEKVQKYRITAARNYLEKNGFKVIPPDGSAQTQEA